MNVKHLFQVFLLFTLLFNPFAGEQPARASSSSDRTDSSPAFQGTDQAPPFVYIAVDPVSVDVGETAVATVNLSNIPAEGYASAELTCSYDASLLEVNNIVVTGLFGADPVAAVNGPEAGRFIAAVAGSHGNKATGDGAVLAFNVKGLQAGQTALSCRVRVSGGDDQLINVYSVPARFDILGDPLTPTVVPAACYKADFLADVSIPSGTIMSPGAAFTKTWRLANIGSCTWTPSYQLAFFSGEQMGAQPFASFPVYVAPGQSVDVSINMIAPLAPGSYHGYWMFRNANGALFGTGPQGNQPWSVDIVVSEPLLTPTFTQSPATSTPTVSPSPSITPGGPTATPITGIAYDFAANVCAAAWFSGAGQLPCPGIDGDPNGFVLRLDHPRLETGVIDTRPGLLTFPQNIQNGTIQGFYPPIHVQNGDHFQAVIGCEGGATTCYVGFRLDYQVGSDPIRALWGPFLERYEGIPFSLDVDLSRLAGQDVRFVLTALAVGSAQGDRALWAHPILQRADTPFTPTATATSSPTPTGTLSSSSSTPTFTSTATTTATVPPEGYGMIVGQVHAGKPVVASFFDANDILSLATAATLDGVFAGSVLPGTYTVIVSADGFLSARTVVTASAGSTTTLPAVHLLAGDIDGNSVIDQFDAMTIGMNYNQATPAIADLNDDGIVNVLDLELLAGNYRKTGPVPWQ